MQYLREMSQSSHRSPHSSSPHIAVLHSSSPHRQRFADFATTLALHLPSLLLEVISPTGNSLLSAPRKKHPTKEEQPGSQSSKCQDELNSAFTSGSHRPRLGVDVDKAMVHVARNQPKVVRRCCLRNGRTTVCPDKLWGLETTT